jgi:hypothetical protein
VTTERVRLGMVVVGGFCCAVIFRSLRHNRHSVPLPGLELIIDFSLGYFHLDIFPLNIFTLEVPARTMSFQHPCFRHYG